MKKEKIRPIGFFWFIYQFLSKLVCHFKFHYKINKNNDFYKRDKKRGAIVLYNHTCNNDHMLSTAFFGMTKVNYVVTRRFDYEKGSHRVFKLVRAIVRDQFKTDMASILKIRKVLDSGGIICIAPTGQVSVTGVQCHTHEAIVKLLKMCKADVYTLRMEGTYLSYPKWGNVHRNYPVNIDCVKIADGETIKGLDNQDLYNRVIKSIDVRDLPNQKKKMIELKGKNLTKGFLDVYNMCPKCLNRYSLSVDNDLITCSKCGNKILYNRFGLLEGVGDNYVVPLNEETWFDLEVISIMNKIKDSSLYMESDVDLYRENKDNTALYLAGNGKLVYNIISLYYEGTIDNEKVHKEFDLSTVYQFPFKPNVRFNIPDNDGFFEFVPKNTEVVTEWTQLAEAIFRVGNSNE